MQKLVGKKRFTAAAVRIAEIAVHLSGSRKSLFPSLDIDSPVTTVECREAKKALPFHAHSFCTLVRRVLVVRGNSQHVLV
jgi:hypothetical protein